MSAHSGRLAELVLYDGACAFCTRWVRFWQPTLARHSFGVSTLQAAHADGTISIPQEHLLDDIRVCNSAGELIGGADAYLYVTRRIWWAWPFYALFHLPGFKQLLERGYKTFARNRYCVYRP